MHFFLKIDAPYSYAPLKALISCQEAKTEIRFLGYMQSQENIVTSSRLEQSLSGFFQERIESNDYTILRVF